MVCNCNKIKLSAMLSRSDFAENRNPSYLRSDLLVCFVPGPLFMIRTEMCMGDVDHFLSSGSPALLPSNHKFKKAVPRFLFTYNHATIHTSDIPETIGVINIL